jgi:hypothetical protein
MAALNNTKENKITEGFIPGISQLIRYSNQNFKIDK